MGFNM